MEGRTILSFLFLLLVLASTTPGPNDLPYDLKGEAPGSTLKQFVANHKHAECSNKSSFQTACHVADDVSFAGVVAQTSRACKTPFCMSQGLNAEFINGKSVRLKYGVDSCPGCFERIVQFLQRQYGPPTSISVDEVTWRNSVGILKVIQSSDSISVSSELNAFKAPE